MCMAEVEHMTNILKIQNAIYDGKLVDFKFMLGGI